MLTTWTVCPALGLERRLSRFGTILKVFDDALREQYEQVHADSSTFLDLLGKIEPAVRPEVLHENVIFPVVVNISLLPPDTDRRRTHKAVHFVSTTDGHYPRGPLYRTLDRQRWNWWRATSADLEVKSGSVTKSLAAMLGEMEEV